MKYSPASELSTILYSIEQGTAKLDLFLADNKDYLINVGLFEKLDGGFQKIIDGVADVSEVF